MGKLFNRLGIFYRRCLGNPIYASQAKRLTKTYARLRRARSVLNDRVEGTFKNRDYFSGGADTGAAATAVW